MLSWVLCVPGTSQKEGKKVVTVAPGGASEGDLLVTVFSSVLVHPSSRLPSFLPFLLLSFLPLSLLLFFSPFQELTMKMKIIFTIDSRLHC